MLCAHCARNPAAAVCKSERTNIIAVFCEWCVMKRIKEGRIDPELVKKLETVRSVYLCE